MSRDWASKMLESNRLDEMIELAKEFNDPEDHCKNTAIQNGFQDQTAVARNDAMCPKNLK